MGFRFRKSFKLGKGAKLNFGRKSVGVSFGGKRGGVSINSRSGARARVSFPGTGLSYTTKLSGGRKSKSSSSAAQKKHVSTSATQKRNVSVSLPQKPANPPKPPKSPKIYFPSGVILSILGLILLFLCWPLGLISMALGVYYIACGPKIYANAVAKYKAVHPEYKEGQ